MAMPGYSAATLECVLQDELQPRDAVQGYREVASTDVEHCVDAETVAALVHHHEVQYGVGCLKPDYSGFG